MRSVRQQSAFICQLVVPTAIADECPLWRKALQRRDMGSNNGVGRVWRCRAHTTSSLVCCRDAIYWCTRTDCLPFRLCGNQLALKLALDGACLGNYRLPTGNYPPVVKGYFSYHHTISILQSSLVGSRPEWTTKSPGILEQYSWLKYRKCLWPQSIQ
jgi:hypothetical protein